MTFKLLVAFIYANTRDWVPALAVLLVSLAAFTVFFAEPVEVKDTRFKLLGQRVSQTDSGSRILWQFETDTGAIVSTPAPRGRVFKENEVYCGELLIGRWVGRIRVAPTSLQPC